MRIHWALSAAYWLYAESNFSVHTECTSFHKGLVCSIYICRPCNKYPCAVENCTWSKNPVSSVSWTHFSTLWNCNSVLKYTTWLHVWEISLTAIQHSVQLNPTSPNSFLIPRRRKELYCQRCLVRPDRSPPRSLAVGFRLLGTDEALRCLDGGKYTSDMKMKMNARIYLTHLSTTS